MRNMKIDPFLKEWVAPQTLRKWGELKTQVVSILGIKLEDIDVFPAFIDLANTIYKLDVQRNETSIAYAIDSLHDRIMAIPKEIRSKLRMKSLTKVNYGIQPKTVKLRKAAAKSGVLNDIGLKQLEDLKTRKLEKSSNLKKSGKRSRDNVNSPPKIAKDEFYKSWDWRTLRMEILKERGARCECCGATPSHVDMSGNPVKICVDHIKPLSRFWHLRLNKSNLQILCDECNQGKGAWDQTDWRVSVDGSKSVEAQIIEIV